MKDFTFKIYEHLLAEVKSRGYECISYEEYIRRKTSLQKFVILRHDVDGRPSHSLQMATIQNKFRVQGTYYFRNVPWSYDEEVIRKIADLGHEIGFHYEDLSQCKGDRAKAIEKFTSFLEKLRTFWPVKTICMHGSPLSRYDNRLIWDTYNYRDFGIIGEPYFDTDFDSVWYVTDTGRAWNNTSSIRDKVSSAFNIRVRNTHELIDLFAANLLPEKIMINIHPQRWTDNPMQWYQEMMVQRAKNVCKVGLNILRPQPVFNNRTMRSA